MDSQKHCTLLRCFSEWNFLYRRSLTLQVSIGFDVYRELDYKKPCNASFSIFPLLFLLFSFKLFLSICLPSSPRFSVAFLMIRQIYSFFNLNGTKQLNHIRFRAGDTNASIGFNFSHTTSQCPDSFAILN